MLSQKVPISKNNNIIRKIAVRKPPCTEPCNTWSEIEENESQFVGIVSGEHFPQGLSVGFDNMIHNVDRYRRGNEHSLKLGRCQVHALA